MRPIALIVILIAVLAVGLDVWWRRSPLPSGGDFGLETQEQTALADSKGLVWRDGHALNFHLGNGAVTTLSDRLLCGDIACPAGMLIGYRYLGWDAPSASYRVAVLQGGETDHLLPFADGSELADSAHSAVGDSGPTPLPAMPAPRANPDPSLKSWQSDLAAARTDEEKPLLAASGGKVSRDSQGLHVTLGDGQHALFADDVICGQIACPQAIYRSFSYGGASPDGRYFVINEHREESSEAMLVDAASGSDTQLLGPPSFSPDGKLVASSISDLETPSPLRLHILSLAGARPETDFEIQADSGDDTLYRINGWVDPDHLRLSEAHWTSHGTSATMLVHDSSAWRLEGPEPAGN